MTPAQHQRVKALFSAASRLSGGERTAYLDEHCDDPEIRAEVEALLGHDEEPLDVLKTPALGAILTKTLGAAVAGRTAPAEIPEQIGQYKVLSLLGEGGMGVVYIAEQERPRRTVALKVIRRGLSSASVVKRFEHEAELLGRLQHPGIAQIYEAGVADSGRGPQPYLAMELVKGVPLSEYAQQHTLSTPDRMRLMIRVCEAVQHAHIKGVIHRDLKPGNILVDSSGAPKILDFGIARATDSEMAVTTIQTSIGQLIGTLPYMSPEQVEGDPAELDTRADVYALGVVLYELLTGKLPYNLRSRSIPEAARIIRDESPERLSSISKLFRGDIETIVSKAMDKDKARRYQSPAELASDLERYLHGQPIAARQDSSMYVLRKQLRRYRNVLVAACLAFAGLTVFAIYARTQAVNERNARTQAELASTEAQHMRTLADQASTRLASQLSTSTIERGRLLARSGSPGAAERMIWAEHAAHPTRHSLWALREFYSEHPVYAAIRAHPDNCRGAALDPQGRTLATCGDDKLVRLWTFPALQPVRDLHGHQSPAIDVAWSPDGRLVAASGLDGRVLVWNHESSEPALVLEGHSLRVRTIAISPDSRTLVSASEDGWLRQWNLESGENVASRNIGDAMRVTFAHDGRIAASNDFGEILVFTTLNEEPELTLKSHTRAVQSLAFSAGDAVLFSGAQDQVIRRWDLATGETTATLRSRNGTIRSMALTPDDRTLWAAGWWSVDAWDARSGTRLSSFPAHAPLTSVNLTPDGSKLICSHDDGLVRVWSLAPTAASTLLASPHPVWRMDVLHGTTDMALSTREGQVWLASAGAMEAPSNLGDLGAACAVLKYSPDRRMVAAMSAASPSAAVLRVWSFADRRLVAEFQGAHGTTQDSMNFSPDSKLIAFAVKEGCFSIRSIADQREVASIPAATGEALSIGFSPDGARVVAMNRDPIMRLFKFGPAGTLEPDGTLDCVTTPWLLRFSPDGERLLIGAWPQKFDLWDMRSRRVVGRLEGHRALPRCIDWCPDDPGLVATAASDGTVRLWDLDTMLPVKTYEFPSGADAVTVRFAGKNELIALSMDGEVARLDLDAFDDRIEANRSLFMP